MQEGDPITPPGGPEPVPDLRAQKKRGERRILNAVYATWEPYHVVDSERPDFLVTSCLGGTPHGVEVCEFFDSETLARLDRIPDYLDELLKEARFRHKDDKTKLGLTTACLYAPDGGIKAAGIKVVLSELPSVSTYPERTAALIQSKAARLSAALRSLPRIDLLICDRTGRFNPLETKYFYHVFCAEVLRSAVLLSPFREVFYLTRLSRRWVSIPLRGLCTLAELFFFRLALARSARARRPTTARGLSLWFGEHLATLTAGRTWSWRGPGDAEIAHGYWGFTFGLKPTDPIGVTCLAREHLSSAYRVVRHPGRHDLPDMRGAISRLRKARRYTFSLCLPAGDPDEETAPAQAPQQPDSR